MTDAFARRLIDVQNLYQFTDCLQSTFSLKIRLVLFSSSAFQTTTLLLRPRFSRFPASPLACLGLLKLQCKLFLVYLVSSFKQTCQVHIISFTTSCSSPHFSLFLEVVEKNMEEKRKMKCIKKMNK